MNAGRYPSDPGFKEQGGTSEEAAERIAPRATIIRAKVLGALLAHPMGLTADEIADYLGISMLSVRPRVSELAKEGRVEKTGERRTNVTGMSAAVWRASK